jgi:predicted membrane channel-forming protein YqfA (hemolysin III family)
MSFTEFIKPELLVLIPVLYVIGLVFKNSLMPDKWIPAVLAALSVFLALLWVLSTSQLITMQDIATGIFTAIVQGVLLAGAAVYTNQLIKQAGKIE